MKRFDVPVEKSDIELQFACDPLRTVTFRGRLISPGLDAARNGFSQLHGIRNLRLDGYG